MFTDKSKVVGARIGEMRGKDWGQRKRYLSDLDEEAINEVLEGSGVK